MIRMATHDDIEQLIEMRWNFTLEHNDSVTADKWEPFQDECREFLLQAINGNKWRIWVAEIDHMVVSHIYVELIEKVPRPGRTTYPYGFMTNVYTRPPFRNKGIGSNLLTAVKDWATNRKLEFLIVWPSDESVEFYTRNDFTLSKESMELHL
ncbi:GNAT family N-acetyltransferase [Brevibacillus daliensis]|uniref:GNAT family N-acetyltransferase n=1 Tax=Brevibacillus daliensis TaxID=2892995 RepID=UPI001E4DCBEA|nr:GNAT family N-acetyltransferase [Brevibacillus daliensis]